MFKVSSDFLTAVKQPSRTVKSSVGFDNIKLTNLVTNGDFSNGLTGWTVQTISNVNTSNGIFSGTPTSAGSKLTLSGLSITSGNKYYFASYISTTNGNICGMFYDGVNSWKTSTHTGSGKYELLSSMITALNTTSNAGQFQPLRDDNSSGWVTDYMKQPILINLTAIYGAGNEPSKAYMDEMIAKIGWFNGSKNAPSKFADDRILTNGVINGNFNNSSGWNQNVVSTWSTSNNELTITLTSTSGEQGAFRTDFSSVVGHKYYVTAKIYPKYKNNFRYGIGNDTVSYSGTNLTTNNWNTVSSIQTCSASTNNIVAYHVVNTSYAVGDTFKLKDILTIDLTAIYGAGNEPTQAYMDNIISTYGWFNTLPLSLSQSGERTIISNFSVESSFGNNDIPTIGGTVSNKLSLTLINDSRMPKTLIGVPIRPYVAIDIGGGVYEWVELGSFYSDYADITKNKLTTSLDAFDKMITHDSCEYSTDLVLPLTVSDVINDLANNPDYNITFASQPSLPNPSLTSVPHGTVRQVLSQLASLMTTNATIDENGDVKFIFLTSSGFTMDKTNYIDFKLEPDSTVKVSQLQIKDGDNVTAVGDGTGFALLLENAQIPDSSTLTTVFNRAFPLTFYAYTMKAQGMPHLQIGDTISFTYVKIDGSTSTITIPILKHKFIFSGGMISEFKASAPKDDTTTLTVTGGSTVEHSVNQAYAELTDAIHDATRLITGNQGGYITTVLSDDGKPQELVISDTVDFNTAKNVWRWNASGLGFSNSGYSGNYGLALTSDGQINASYITIGGMSAQRITAGRLQDKNGLSWLDLDTGQFSFGSGKLAWDGSKFTIKYNGTDLDSALNNKANQSDLQPYVDNITIGTNGITVGKTGNPFAVNITNMAVEFLDYGTGSGAYTPSSNTIAYITGKKMYITDLQTTNSIQVGNHQVYKYDANITLIKYVG